MEPRPPGSHTEQRAAPPVMAHERPGVSRDRSHVDNEVPRAVERPRTPKPVSMLLPEISGFQDRLEPHPPGTTICRRGGRIRCRTIYGEGAGKENGEYRADYRQ